MITARRLRRQLTLLTGDLVCVVLSVFVASLIRFGPPSFFLVNFKTVTVLCCLIFLTLFYVADLYNPQRRGLELATTGLIGFCVGLGTVIVTLTFYFVPRWKLGRGIFLLIVLVTPVLVLAWRMVWFRFQQAVGQQIRVSVIGGGEAAEEVRDIIARQSGEFLPVELSQIPADDQTNGPNSGRQESIKSALRTAITNSQTDVVVVTSPLEQTRGDLVRMLIEARFSGLSVFDAPTFIQSTTGKLPVEYLNDGWFITASGFRLFQGGVVRVKRLSDLVLASVGLLICSPLIILAAVLLILFSHGPVFYSQERVGLNGRLFRLVKFRSMAVGAEEVASPTWAGENDPRVDRIGSFLRAYHLDELPQLINILKSEMSFVGPRPERPFFVEKLEQIIPYYRLRHSVRPGLTGWAQVNYQYGASVEDALEKLKYDLFYIQHVSLFLDTKILLKTIRTVLTRKGSR